jgi:signal transduction histidine kinase
MFSSILRSPRHTAAWRLSVWSTLAFAIGTALAFLVMYLLVENSVRDRTDAWLSGEAEVLSNVAMNTPQDSLYKRIVEEVAELATREIADEAAGKTQYEKSIFFVETVENQAPLWIGPEPREVFLNAIERAHLVHDIPQSIYVDDSPIPFRVVASGREHGTVIYLGLIDHAAINLLNSLTRRFVMVWVGMVVLGFVIAYASASRTLNRVERITETVARIGTDDLANRLPEAGNSDEISRLSRTFNHMLDRIQASVNQTRTVTDSVAHDLKSPVTWIRGRLEGALSDSSDSSWREPVAEAIEGLDQMAQLLNTTLDLAEAAAGALHLERTRIDLTALVQQLVDLYQPALSEHHHQVDAVLPSGVAVDADVSLMTRVVGNLLDNELKHLPDGCRIHIQLAPVNGQAELRIEDNGPGFSPELRQRAFDRFVKGKQSSGHGLGLAFVDAVVRAHGGNVGISDRAGGAVIVITLQLAAANAEVHR